MPLEHVDTTNVDNHTATTTAVVDRPTGLAAGDGLLAFVAIIGLADITPPAGWVQLGAVVDDGNQLRTAVYRRAVDGSEPASWTWGFNLARKNFVVVAAYRGNHSALVASYQGAAGTSGTSHQTPTVQVPAGGWLVTFAAARNLGAPACTWTISTGDAERYDSGSDQADPSQNITGCVYDTNGPVASAGDYDRTLTSSVEVSLIASWSVALRPATAGEVHVGWHVGGAAIGLEAAGPAPEPDDIEHTGAGSVLVAVSSAASLAVPVPAGAADGDTMLAFITAVAAVTITPPAGWTQVGTTRTDGQLVSAVYRRLASSEPASYTWTLSGSTRSSGHIAAYRNVDATSPVADFNSAGVTEAGTTIDLPAVSVPDDGWLVYWPCDRRASPVTEQTWSSSDASDVRRAQVSGATGASNQSSSAVFDSDRPLTAGTPTRTLTASEGWSNAAAVWAVALTRAS